jgi:hypothetical protein
MSEIAFAEHRERWSAIAVSLKPTLHYQPMQARQWVRCVPDGERWSALPIGPINGERPDEPLAVLDFGEHVVGQIGLELDPKLMGDGRCIVRTGETVDEVAIDLDRLEPGKLGGEWLRPMSATADADGRAMMNGRRALRYLRVTDEQGQPLAVRSAWVNSVTSAGDDIGPPADLQLSDAEKQLDQVALRTLRNCMQGIFEDGPKRDRRLWLGDLRLQAQAAYLSVGGFDLVRRCLYLFAMCADEQGVVPPCVYERPNWHAGPEFIPDYAMLFAPTLLDYVRATGDWATAREFWPVALAQMTVLNRYVNPANLFDAPPDVWQFIDWNDELDRQASEQATAIYMLNALQELAAGLGYDDTVTQPILKRNETMRAAAVDQLFDAELGLFVSGPDRQVSWASQSWMVLAGVVRDEQATELMRKLLNFDSDAVKPVCPYLYHHVVEALLLAGLRSEATELVWQYWGSMLDQDATTFWEVHAPDRPTLSPYGSHLHNSYCHAWSCTPLIWVRRGVLHREAQSSGRTSADRQRFFSMQ